MGVSKSIAPMGLKRTFRIEGDIAAATGAATYYMVKTPFRCKLSTAIYLQSVAANGATEILINVLPNTNATDAEVIKQLTPMKIATSVVKTGTETKIMGITTLTALGTINGIPATGYATEANRTIYNNDQALYIVVPTSATTAHSGKLILDFVEA